MLTHKKVGEMFKEIIPDIHPINLSYYLMLKEIDYPFELVCDLWDKSYANISDGEKQIISILRILCKKNNVLILDEPFSNLDVLKKAWLVNMLKDIKKDKIIILISHDKEVLSHCDEIIRFS
jgi:ABC-type lipoprotein export system ATPase subunit